MDYVNAKKTALVNSVVKLSKGLTSKHGITGISDEDKTRAVEYIWGIKTTTSFDEIDNLEYIREELELMFEGNTVTERIALHVKEGIHDGYFLVSGRFHMKKK